MAVTALGEVQERVALASVRSGRAAEEVQLVAVSKNRTAAAIRDAYEQGQRVFGENRQQGLARRIDEGLPGDISWHFIGRLQSRKAPFVAEHADLLHSFDRLDLIKRWGGTTTPVLLQFNMAGEPQKGGFDPASAPEAFAKVCDAGVVVKGVMAIPPQSAIAEDSRRWFVQLREVFDKLAETSSTVDTLSMGMSNDYEVAIEEGATLVRVGTAIFGPLKNT
jgi:pyridoxal phosphate enzyme (YggS family)